MTGEILRHGAYLCLTEPLADLSPIAERLGFVNEFHARDGHPPRAIAFLRRVHATATDIDDAGLLRARAIVHIAAPEREPIDELCAAAAGENVLRGVVRPRMYTSPLMHDFAYAHQVLQQPGTVMPNAFLVPMRKTEEWWKKEWFEKETYFLPRYDDSGRMINEGHALAAAAGIRCLLRRTYRSEQGQYDFVNYFECSDADVPTFRDVCHSLRDVNKNPEWKFVREGPTWHGRRVATWTEMFST